MKTTVLFRRKTNILHSFLIAFVIAVLGSQAPVNAETVRLAVANSNNELTAIVSKTKQELTRRITNLESSKAAISGSTVIPTSTKTQLDKTNTDALAAAKDLQSKVDSATTTTDAQQNATTADSQYTQYQIANMQGTASADVSSQSKAQTQLSDLIKQAQSQVDSICSQATSGSTSSGSTSSTANSSTISAQAGCSSSASTGTGSSSSGSGSSSGSSSSSGLQQIIQLLVQIVTFIASIITAVIALIAAIQSGNTAAALTAATTIMTTILGQLGLTSSMLTQATTAAQGVVTTATSLTK